MEAGLNLPVGVGSFELLRAGRLRYVDKTRAIGRLASVPSGRFFLTRPRRFGKSLLVSTLLSLFRHGLRDFDGLAVSSFWKDKTYDVLRLDFSQARGTGSLQDFHARAASLFQDALAEAGLPGLDPAAVKAAPFAAFSQFLASRSAGSLVVLIDEYDAPLVENRDKPALSQAILDDLAGFYADLKACESRLRFLYITGILRIPPAGLFSGLALATDIAFDSEAGALLGFTQDEIERHFGEALNHAQEVLGLGRDALMRELARQYGGYCFDPMAGITVFSPWSVLQFLKNPALGFEPHWVETAGTQRVLLADE